MYRVWNRVWLNTTLNIEQDKYHAKKDDIQYITNLHLTSGYMLLLTGYLLAALVHTMTVLKTNLIAFITMKLLGAALEGFHVGKVHVHTRPEHYNGRGNDTNMV